MNKRKLMLVAVALCMVAILGFGGTLAYLTDTDNAKNVFTAGNVGLTLDEAKVEKDENGDFVSVTPAERVKEQTYHVFPGNDILKDPTVNLTETSEDAWIAIKLVIKCESEDHNLHELIGGVEGHLDLTKIASGGLMAQTTSWMTYHGMGGFGNENYFIYQDVSNADQNEWTMYIYMMQKTSAGHEPIVIFNKMHIPEAWDNAEMEIFNKSSIDITAYAVQADGFVDAYEAMQAASSDEVQAEGFDF